MAKSRNSKSRSAARPCPQQPQQRRRRPAPAQAESRETVAAAEEGSKSLFRLYSIAAAVALLGLADALYLTVEHLTGQSVRCTITSGCDEVLSSPYASFHSIPLAGLGALAYFAAFSLATLAAFGYRQASGALLLLVGLMFLTTLWLLYVQAFVLHAFCQYCLISAAVTSALTALVILARTRKA